MHNKFKMWVLYNNSEFAKAHIMTMYIFDLGSALIKKNPNDSLMYTLFSNGFLLGILFDMTETNLFKTT